MSYNKPKLNVAFDVSSLYRKYRLHSGIPRYVGLLLNELNLNKEVNLIKFVNCTELGNRLDRSRLNEALINNKVTAVYNSGRFEGINLREHDISIIHTTFYPPPEWMLGTSAKWIATVHDLRPLDDPSSCTRRHVDLFKRMGVIIKERATYVHSVSNYSRSRIVDLWNIPTERIRVIRPSNPTNIDKNCIEDKLEDAHKPYILFLSTVQPAKDVETALFAYKSILGINNNYQLVVAGSDNKHEPKMKLWEKLKIEGKIIRLKRVSDIKKMSLLKHASAVLCTSRYEGFGFVPLEAIHVGVPPVVSSAYPCLELMPHWPYTFKSGDKNECKNVLLNVLHKNSEVKKRIRMISEQLKNWSWRDVANNFISLYKEAMDLEQEYERQGQTIM